MSLDAAECTTGCSTCSNAPFCSVCSDGFFLNVNTCSGDSCGNLLMAYQSAYHTIRCRRLSIWVIVLCLHGYSSTRILRCVSNESYEIDSLLHGSVGAHISQQLRKTEYTSQVNASPIELAHGAFRFLCVDNSASVLCRSLLSRMRYMFRPGIYQLHLLL